MTYHLPPAVAPDNAFNGNVCGDWLEGAGCRFQSAFGVVDTLLTNTLAWHEGAVVTEETVDGRVARIVRYDPDSQLTPGAQSQFVAAVHVPVVDAEARGAPFTMSAFCDSEPARDDALRVLRTLEFDELPRELRALPEDPCTGTDVRPLTGYVLGDTCVHDELPVPGACALDARKNGVTGNGLSMCLVAADGTYYTAFVQYGETVVKDGSAYGEGQLAPADMERCAELTSALEHAAAAELRISNRPLYESCR